MEMSQNRGAKKLNSKYKKQMFGPPYFETSLYPDKAPVCDWKHAELASLEESLHDRILDGSFKPTFPF